MGFVVMFKQFSDFEFSLLPSRIHARPSAMPRERKSLGGSIAAEVQSKNEKDLENERRTKCNFSDHQM
jgi:hypothetical protein